MVLDGWRLMRLSIVIPAYNEEGSIEQTISQIGDALCVANIDHEIIVCNDHSSDQTEEVLRKICRENKAVKYINNPASSGYGMAVRCGFDHCEGDCVAIMMADLSDHPDDLVAFYRVMVEKDVDCVFGSRFIKGGEITNYPPVKLLLNRFANLMVKWVFRLDYNDCTNAFKLFRRETIEGLKPFLSPHYNLTLELPLKAIVRGYSYAIVPNRWVGRKSGVSKLKIKEMGSRYFFIFLYCFIEKYFSKGDYRKINN